MKTIFDHIETVKGKPHHIRRRVAFGAAGGGAALIALVWLVGNISLGTFAIKPTSFADTAGETPVVKTSEANGNIAGVAAAIQNANTPAHIEIVDTVSSTSAKKQVEQTTIPF